MIKRTILAACVTAFAFAALPALATAEPVTNNPGDPYLEGVTEGKKFTVAGGEPKLTASFGTVKCKKISGSGEFFDRETGSLTLKFEECIGPLGVKCTTAGQSEGTIATTTLPFHLKTVAHLNAKGETEHKPGVLITPGPSNEHGPHFYTFSCPLLGAISLGGNGLIGTITKPEEGVASNTMTLSFSSTEPGSNTQTHRFVTNDPTEYDRKTRINGGETKTSALDAETVITFAEGMKPTLETTPLE